ncbi:MAG: alanine racemase C-terminal domain-containing protein [Hyphomicrobiales bacterium]
MNRLGLTFDDVETVADARDLWADFALSLVMSHLACADEPEHAKNEAQRRTFDELRARLPSALTSLANSAGIMLGPDFVYDLVRPGIALYGGHPQRVGPNPFRTVVHLKGRILQVREVAPGETLGYGATRTLQRPSRIATVSVGYADGLFRTLSRGDGEQGPAVHLGRSCRADPGARLHGSDHRGCDWHSRDPCAARRWVEVLGPNTSAHELAAHAGTIDYEVLTALSQRALRRYIGGS